MNYQEFLNTKRKGIVEAGFDCENLNDHLFDFQKYIVKKSLKAGKYAIWADCGLGKTIMQLEFAHQVNLKTKKPVLILAPLAVSAQTIDEGRKFGISIGHYGENKGIDIINYEQIENIDCSIYSGIVLDESSILKNYEGKIKNRILDAFDRTLYKLACTATPSPNDVIEIGNHAEFLGVMTRAEMLAMYFVHDGGETQKWRLKGHSVKDFWKWVSTWSIMLSSPSDIGFNGSDFILPKLNLLEHQIKTETRIGSLFNDVSVSATDFNKELRITKHDRLEHAAEIINSSKENFIIWVKQNEEADMIKKLIPDAVDVRGSEERDAKEEKLLGFAKNKFRVLLTKSKIAQYGMNYQNCHNQVFCSLDFSFESLYQSIRRSYRFGQKHQVNIHLITTDTMQNVIQSIKNKQTQFEEMKKQMIKNYEN